MALWDEAFVLGVNSIFSRQALIKMERIFPQRNDFSSILNPSDSHSLWCLRLIWQITQPCWYAWFTGAGKAAPGCSEVLVMPEKWIVSIFFLLCFNKRGLVQHSIFCYPFVIGLFPCAKDGGGMNMGGHYISIHCTLHNAIHNLGEPFQSYVREDSWRDSAGCSRGISGPISSH